MRNVYDVDFKIADRCSRKVYVSAIDMTELFSKIQEHARDLASSYKDALTNNLKNLQIHHADLIRAYENIHECTFREDIKDPFTWLTNQLAHISNGIKDNQSKIDVLNDSLQNSMNHYIEFENASKNGFKTSKPLNFYTAPYIITLLETI